MAESLEVRFGKRCKKLRAAAGLTQMDVVAQGFTLSHYQKLERGDLDPRLSTALRLAKVFGVTAGKLLDGL